MERYVDVLAEGDIWNYNAVANACTQASRIFLHGVSDAEKTIDGLHRYVLGEDRRTLQGANGNSIKRDGVKFVYHQSHSMRDTSMSFCAYNEEDGGIVDTTTGEKHLGVIKVDNHPVIFLDAMNFKARTKRQIEERERFIDSVLSEILKLNIGIYLGLENDARKLKTVKPESEYYEFAHQMAKPENRNLIYALEFQREKFYIGRGEVCVELKVFDGNLDDNDIDLDLEYE